MAKVGRPSKVSPEVTERFVQAVQIGATYDIACKYAGISYQTLCNWRERKEAEFVEFFEALTRAEGVAVIKWLAVLEKHGEATGQWAAWKLERRYPETFGRRDRITIDVKQLDTDIERELEIFTAGGQGKASGEIESETVN